MTSTKTSTAYSVARRAFLPATWLLNRLRYAPKFIIIGLVFLLPFGYVSYLQFRGTTDDVEFNEYERDGVSYISPTLNYLYALQRHRLYVAAVGAGDAQAQAKADEAAADAARFENEVDEMDARLGGELKTTARWIEAKAAWAHARDDKFADPREADRAHEDVTAIVADLIVNYAGNYSKLILDPDLDSYWLMDAFVIKLPSLGNSVSRLSSRAVLSSAGSLDAQYELAGESRLIEVTAGDLKSVNIATALKETKNFGKSKTLVRLSEPLEQLTVAIGAARQAVQREYLGATPTRTTAPVTDNAVAALAQLHGMALAVAPELDFLVAQRVDRYRGDRRAALIAASIAGLLLLYLFIGFFIAVRDSVGDISEATRRMIAGTTETFQLATRDELAQVARDYNQICCTMARPSPMPSRRLA